MVEVVETASLTAFAMIVSRIGCLQAVGNECEFVGNECEQNGRLVGNESEQTNAMFASRGEYVCKLLHLRRRLLESFLRNTGSFLRSVTADGK